METRTSHLSVPGPFHHSTDSRSDPTDDNSSNGPHCGEASPASHELSGEGTEPESVRELADSRDFLEAVLETAVDAILTLDRHGTIYSANSSATRMFGYSIPELVGLNIGQLMPSAFRRSHDSYVSKYMHGQGTHVRGVRRETVAFRKDGSDFSVDLAVSEIDHRGRFTAFVRDLSERKVLERQVLDIANQEQRRIGQELHDCTGQELTGLTLMAGSMLDAISRECESGKPVTPKQLEAWRAVAAKLASGLNIANKHVQQLSRGLMPVQIDREGLRSALLDLCAATNDLPNVKCRLSCPEQLNTESHHCATQLFRIAQEAVNNALRHGAATEIELKVDRNPDEGFLEIRDNGKGFVVEESFSAGLPEDSYVPRKSGHGLRIMRYRASMIGGTLDVQSRPGQGTTIRCSFSFHQ